jgi:hypothetical protein
MRQALFSNKAHSEKPAFYFCCYVLEKKNVFHMCGQDYVQTHQAFCLDGFKLEYCYNTISWSVLHLQVVAVC